MGDEHECIVCHKIYQHRDHLATHLSAHITDVPNQCVLCKQTFKSRGHLKKHVESHIVYPCKVCEKTFKAKQSFLCHMKLHGENLFQCEICEKVFFNNNVLATHLKNHRQEQELLCKNCGQANIHASFVRKHLPVGNFLFTSVVILVLQIQIFNAWFVIKYLKQEE